MNQETRFLLLALSAALDVKAREAKLMLPGQMEGTVIAASLMGVAAAIEHVIQVTDAHFADKDQQEPVDA